MRRAQATLETHCAQLQMVPLFCARSASMITGGMETAAYLAQTIITVPIFQPVVVPVVAHPAARKMSFGMVHDAQPVL